LLGSRYFPAEKGRFEQLTTVPVAVLQCLGEHFHLGKLVERVATTAISRQWWKSRTGGGINATVANQIPEAFNNPCFAASSGMSDRRSEERVRHGTGFESGWSLFTNAHVVAEADTVQVTQGWSEF